PPVTIATCPARLPITGYWSGGRGAAALRGWPELGATRLRSSPAVASRGREASTLSSPGPDRLLEVGDPGRAAMDDDLAHLIEHGRRRRVHQRGEQRHLDDGPVALGDRDQARDVGAIEVGERHPMDARDLGGIRDERRARTAPDDHGGDDEARARAVVVEQPEDRGLVALEPDLLPELAERRALGALARVDPASGQRPLSRVGAERCSATGQ